MPAALILFLLILGSAIAVRTRLAADAHGPQAGGTLPLDGSWVPTALRTSVTSVQIVSGKHSLLLAATTDGIWRSTDAGDTWRPDGTGLQGNAVFVLAGSPSGAARWAGSFDGAIYAREGTGDTAAVWRRVSPVLRTDPAVGAVPVYSLAVSAAQGPVLLAGSQGAIFRGEPSAGGHTWRWVRTWQAPASAAGGTDAITSLLVTPWDPRLVFASVFGATPAVLASRDGGRTWAPMAAGLPAILPVQDLAAGSPHERAVYLTTMGGGVWRRGMDGRWVDVSAGLPQRHAMALLAAGPGVLYAGTMGLGVYEKQGNRPWQPLGHGLRGPATTVMGLVVTPGAHPALLAATTQGVYRYAPGACGPCAP